jgi:hypothetical protein
MKREQETKERKKKRQKNNYRNVLEDSGSCSNEIFLEVCVRKAITLTLIY